MNPILAAYDAATDDERREFWRAKHGRENVASARDHARAAIHYDRLIASGKSPLEALRAARVRLPMESWQVFADFIKSPRKYGRIRNAKKILLGVDSFERVHAPIGLTSE